MTDAERLSKETAVAVLKDLHDRKGIGDELDGVRSEYPDTYREIKQSISKIILAHIEDYV